MGQCYHHHHNCAELAGDDAAVDRVVCMEEQMGGYKRMKILKRCRDTAASNLYNIKPNAKGILLNANGTKCDNNTSIPYNDTNYHRINVILGYYFVMFRK